VSEKNVKLKYEWMGNSEIASMLDLKFQSPEHMKNHQKYLVGFKHFKVIMI